MDSSVLTKSNAETMEGKILGGGDEIDIVSTPHPEGAERYRQARRMEISFSQPLLADGILLAEAAAKYNSVKNTVPASVDSADPRLLPLMKGRPVP